MDWPKPATGSSAFAAWINKFLSKAKTCTPISIEGYDIELGTDGFRAKRKAKSGGGTSTTLDANYKLMIITGLGSALTPAKPDLLICQAFDPVSKTASGPNVYVAKDTEARQVAKEFYFDNGDNVTVNYSYFTGTAADASYGDNFRMANDGTNSELQVMEKRYYTQAMLAAIAGMPLTQAVIQVVDTGVATGVTDPAGNSVTRIEVKPVRVWIRQNTQ